LTANADADEVQQYLAAGMRSVVEKPIKPERLLEALDGALNERAQAAAA
jgi:CheY-like chemotaxis protein